MVYFQFAFAAITVIITAGAFLCRMNFKAWMIFVPLWLTFSYTIGAFSIWGGGWAFQRGVIDYSGEFSTVDDSSPKLLYPKSVRA